MPEPTPTDHKMPSLVPDAGERDSHHRAVGHRPTTGGGSSRVAVWTLSLMLLLTLVAIAGGGLWFWEQLQQASVKMTQQDASLEQVRQRLSNTHIDLSEHSKGLAGQLSSFTAQQNQLQEQVSGIVEQMATLELGQRQLHEQQRELVSRQQQVAEQHKQLAQRQKRQDQQWQRSSQSLNKGVQALREESQGLLVRLEALREKSTHDSGEWSTAMTVLQDQWHGVDDQLRQLSESAALLDRRILLSEEWIEGINAYRREINERIFRMQQLLINRVSADAGVESPTADDIGLDLQELAPPDLAPATISP